MSELTMPSFEASTTAELPPEGLSDMLEALWWVRKGSWEKAHNLAQAREDATGAWIHAYLHRVEGDQGNAGYWYRRAGRPAATGGLDAEWRAIAAELISGDG